MSRSQRLTIEQLVERASAGTHLENLVHAGCNRDEILGILSALHSSFTDDSWDHLAGVPLKTLKGAVKRIEKCASEVERLNHRPLVWASANYGPPEHRKFYDIPALLRGYVAFIQSAIPTSGPKKHGRENAFKAWLVAMVLARADKPHDRDVAGLISAALDIDYDTTTHGEWRRNHKNLVALTLQAFKKR